MDRMQTFLHHELTLIHDASMQILKETGVNFNDEETVDLFRAHGFRTDGKKVYFRENDILKAIQNTPSKFTVHARNPEKSAAVGEGAFVYLPTGGAPNVMMADGTMRPGTLSDFINCCKLVQTSEQLDIGGYLMVQPNDVPESVAHLHMMQNYLSLCDKPLFGASATSQAARDTIDIIALFFGGLENIKKMPVMISVVNSASPLQYSGDQARVILTMAEYNQPLVIANMVLAGASGPVDLPGLLALQNAETLAGITLAQLVSPGCPVVYGSTSAPMDMKTMCSAVGASETLKVANATIQLANHYNLPSRCGGSLTDAHVPDAQALAEGALMLSSVVRKGANVIYHACGQLGSYISMSFEKWLIDEEVCQTVRQMIEPMEITRDTIDVTQIHEVGNGGQYLTHPKTFLQFKSLSQPRFFNRKDFYKWHAGGFKRIDQTASEALVQRLEDYEKPPIDPGIETALKEFTLRREREILGE